MTAPSHAPMSKVEFIALMGMTFATIAFSTDAMLPALPEIAAELGATGHNTEALIVLMFIAGTGVGTFFTGPMSDAWGRKPVIIGGGVVYVAATLVAWKSASFEVIMAARFVQGLGAAGPRVVAIAVVRDLYAGRGMAKILSFCMIVFTLFPAVAPLIGAGIIWAADWRAIFLAFVAFSMLTTLWTVLRLPETLAPENRRPIRTDLLMDAVRQMWVKPLVRLSVAAQVFCFASIFAAVSTIQLIFDQSFGMNDSFPVWFFGMAVIGGTASFLNAMLVESLGMRRLIKSMLSVQVVISSIALLATLTMSSGTLYFAVVFFWLTSMFFQAGLTIGNINALAMEELGHIAGIATSVMASIATVASAIIAAPVSLLFDGTPLTLAVGSLIFAACALALMIRIGPDPAATGAA